MLTAAVMLAGAACSGDGSSVTPLSSSAPEAAATASAAAKVAAAPIVVSGSGSTVPHVTLPAANYIVSWTAKGGTCYGSAGCNGDNFMVDVVGGNGSDNIVNEITSSDVATGSKGETLLSIHQSGSYLLKIVASNLTWTLTFTQA